MIIPPALAYGHRSPVKDIPPNATPFCGIELVDAREHTLSELIARPIEKDGPAATERMVKSLKPGLEKQYYVSEDGLNALRYQYLGKNRVPHAIAIFKINAEQFPNSANVYDSLAGAYMKGGNANNAIANYRKSFRLDPTNKNAAEMLRQLGVSAR